MEIKLPAFEYSQDEWNGFSSAEKGLLIAAQETNTYHSAEEPQGSNHGPRVDVYNETAKCDLGSPWCASFITYCLVQAGLDVLSSVPEPAAVVNWLDWAKQNGRWTSLPARGHLFIIDRNGETHMGFCADGADPFATYEGNTNTDGSREGYTTAHRTRHVSNVTGFIDLSDL